MKLTPLSPRSRRVVAIGLLLPVGLLAYFLLLHWWFVAPLHAINAQMADLCDTQSRYAAAIAEKPMLEQRLAALGSGEGTNSTFLPESDPNTAAADLMQRVVDAVAAHTQGGSCTVTQKMPVSDNPTGSSEPYRKAAVSINLSCDIQPLTEVLQALEQGTPYLFVDNLSIYRNPVAAKQSNGLPLDVQFTLSGYVRPRNTVVAASTSEPPSSAGAGRLGDSGATP